MATLGFPLFPEQASTVAGRIDELFFFLVIVSLFFATLICVLIITFAIKYRRRHDDERPPAILGNLQLEILWTTIPLALTMVMFVWGARLYFVINARPMTRWKLPSSPSSGCGRCSIPKDSRRSTNCISPPGGQLN
jgi:heme/copper-type cytochrome/quinol oxidase subunit 2